MAQITARRYHRFRNSLCDSKTPLRKKWPDMKMSYFHTLLAEVCTGVAPEVNAKVLAWGKQYDNDAKALFEFTSGVNVTESPIIYRDESMRTACSLDGLQRPLTEMPIYLPGFHEIPARWFRGNTKINSSLSRRKSLTGKRQ